MSRANAPQISSDSCIRRMFISVDHCWRSPPPLRPDAPAERKLASRTTTRMRLRTATLYAMASPMMPPPMITRSALAGGAPATPGSRRRGSFIVGLLGNEVLELDGAERRAGGERLQRDRGDLGRRGDGARDVGQALLALTRAGTEARIPLHFLDAAEARTDRV